MNKQTSLITKILLLVVVLVVQAGCIKKTTRLSPGDTPLPAITATRAELFEKLRESSSLIKTLKGTVNLDLTKGGPKSGVLDEYRQTKGYVFVERPAHIRIQVQAPVLASTVAIMVSDGAQYKVSIPVKNQFAVSNIDAPIDPNSTFGSLRPQIFLDGLFVDITRFVDNPNIKSLFEESVSGIRSFYIFSFFDQSGGEAELLEKIWIDRKDLRVSRKQVFGKDGRLETDVDYQEYTTEETGPALPKVIAIHRPVEEFSVKMTFTERTLNETVESKVFELTRPDGANLVQLAK